MRILPPWLRTVRESIPAWLDRVSHPDGPGRYRKAIKWRHPNRGSHPLLAIALPLFVLAFAPFATSAAPTPGFILREQLGHAWSNECVRFPLSEPDQAAARELRPLLDQDGRETVYQVVATGGQKQVVVQVDLAPYATHHYRFSDDAGARAAASTDLRIDETADTIRMVNDRIGLEIHRNLPAGGGPLARIRLASGVWTGGSRLDTIPALASYDAQVVADGPVFAEAVCRLVFADQGHWTIRFRIERGEPVVLIDEDFDAPGGGRFIVRLSDETFHPTDLLFRSGKDDLGVLKTRGFATGRIFSLQPWLQWWSSERQGNWFALYTAYRPDLEVVIGDITPGGGGAALPGALNAAFDELLDDLAPEAAAGPPDEHPDLLMIGVLRPSLWRDPAWRGKAKQPGTTVAATAAANGSVAVTFPLAGGRRRWMLGTPAKAPSIAALEPPNQRLAPLPQRYLIKHGDFPLDEIKDLVLEWPGDHAHYPRLFIDRDDVPALRDRLDADAVEVDRWISRQPIDKYNLEGPLRQYFASANPALGRRLIEAGQSALQRVVINDFLTQNTRVTMGVAPHNQAVHLVPMINLTDAVLAVPELDPEQRRRILARLAFLGYTVHRADYWSPPRGYAANPNMTTLVAGYQTAFAALLPSHPLATTWAADGLRELHRQLHAWSDPDGGWLEAPHYAMVSYEIMLGSFLMAARAGFADYVYEERMRKVLEWFAAISTPPDARTGGGRHLPPIGNTYHGEPTSLFGIAAGIWSRRDPAFAARLEGMHREHQASNLGIGWSFPTMEGYKTLLAAHGIEPVPPDWGSAWFRKTGVVLRNGMQSDRETYLHLIAGSNHEHYDYDSGSIMLYGKGRILADDWGYIGRHAAHYHSLVTAYGGGRMQIERFSAAPALDTVSGRSGAWRRQIVFCKDADPLGANFFLMRDSHSADKPAAWRLWLKGQVDPPKGRERPSVPSIDAGALTARTARDPLLDDLVMDMQQETEAAKAATEPARPEPVALNPEGALVNGRDDVDLDIFIDNPAAHALRTETASQRGVCGRRDGQVAPYTMIQTALIADLPANGALTVLLYPRLKDEPSPGVTWLADGLAVEVVSTHGTDIVFVAPGFAVNDTVEFSCAERALSIRGQAGAIRRRGAATTLSLGGGGGEIRFGPHRLAGDGPVSETYRN